MLAANPFAPVDHRLGAGMNKEAQSPLEVKLLKGTATQAELVREIELLKLLLEWPLTAQMYPTTCRYLIARYETALEAFA